MNGIRTTLESSFVVDKPKLNRLTNLIYEKFSELGHTAVEHHEVHFTSHRVFETNSLTEVLQLDNSRRNQVEKFMMHFSVSSADGKSPLHEVNIEFDGRTPPDINLVVKSDNVKWASDVMAITEEQAERMLQRSFLYKWANSEGWIPGSVMLLLLLAFLFVFNPFKSMEIDNRFSLQKTMWLTDGDLKELQEILATSSTLSSEKVGDVIARQIRNISANKKNVSLVTSSIDWRSWLVALPFVVSAGCFVYLLINCYPPSAFLWGDEEEWYTNIISKRNTIWQLIVIGIVIGLISNLAVLGFSAFLPK